MSTPRVLTGWESDAIYVAWGDKGVIHRLTADGQVTEQLREPCPLEPMISADDAAEWAADRLADVKLSKAARKVIGEALGVDW